MSQEQAAKVLSLYPQLKSVRKVAKLLGVSYMACYGLLLSRGVELAQRKQCRRRTDGNKIVIPKYDRLLLKIGAEIDRAADAWCRRRGYDPAQFFGTDSFNKFQGGMTR